MSRRKELHFFSFDRNWAAGLEWYSKQFDRRALMRGESSPSYTKFPHVPNVPERMAAVLPDAKLIYVVRHPIERAISHYFHVKEGGRDDRSLNVALSEFENNQYLNTSKYHMQLERYLPYYPLSQILVVKSEDLRLSREATLRRVFRFLEVDEWYRSERHAMLYHVSGSRGSVAQFISQTRLAKRARPYVPPAIVDWVARHSSRQPMHHEQLDKELRAELTALFSEDIALLRDALGNEFVPWPL
jgi:hypothetical protein